MPGIQSDACGFPRFFYKKHCKISRRRQQSTTTQDHIILV